MTIHPLSATDVHVIEKCGVDLLQLPFPTQRKNMKNVLWTSLKAAAVGGVVNMVVRRVLPKAVPGGVAALIAVQIASHVLGNKKSRPAQPKRPKQKS